MIEHSFQKQENAILVIPNPAFSRGLGNPISKEEVYVSNISKSEIRIKNRNSPICCYNVINLYGIACGKRVEESVSPAFLFVSEQDYELAVEAEKVLSEILSYAKSETMKTHSIEELKKILSLLK